MKYCLLILMALTAVPLIAQYDLDLYVAADGSADYTTIQSALDVTKAFLDERITIHVKNGVYHEKVKVHAWNNHVTLRGESADSTLIRYGDYFDGIDRGRNSTFHTPTLLVQGDDFRAENLTVENTAGPVGQAVAVAVEADRAEFRDCRFLGNQDTLYADGANARQYYKNCYIEGTTDFIFGAATALFEDCTIHSKSDSYVTAASTPEGRAFGFVFLGCRLTAAPGVDSVFLGRPWRDFAKTVFVNCELGDHILPGGWDNWSSPERERTTYYAEYNSSGPGAAPAARTPWSHQLTEREAAGYDRATVLQAFPLPAFARLSAQEASLLIISNPSSAERVDACVHIPAHELEDQLGLDSGAALHFLSEGREVPYQPLDADQDGKAEAYLLLLDVPAQGSVSVTPRVMNQSEAVPTFPKRTQAELSRKVDGFWKDRVYQQGHFENIDSLAVPPEHTDHSWYLRYEGPGWESDLVGYRFYLDWRNATDVFGKKTPKMALQNVGLDGFDSYHESSDWGMDVLKVGRALGLGSLATWYDDHALRVEETDSVTAAIVENGPVESRIRTRYFGWRIGERKTDVISELSIRAGSRLTRHDVSLSEPLDSLATGIVKLETGELLRGDTGEWSYLATWGPQSLANDLLGLAVIYRTADRLVVTEDDHSHVIVLAPTDRKLTYYFLATWEQDTQPIRTKEAFTTYLEQQLDRLNQPVTLSYANR